MYSTPKQERIRNMIFMYSTVFQVWCQTFHFNSYTYRFNWICNIPQTILLEISMPNHNIGYRYLNSYMYFPIHHHQQQQQQLSKSLCRNVIIIISYQRHCVETSAHAPYTKGSFHVAIYLDTPMTPIQFCVCWFRPLHIVLQSRLQHTINGHRCDESPLPTRLISLVTKGCTDFVSGNSIRDQKSYISDGLPLVMKAVFLHV